MNERSDAKTSRTADTRVIPARQLFGQFREIQIEFRGELYNLRITKNDKLILTK